MKINGTPESRGVNPLDRNASKTRASDTAGANGAGGAESVRFSDLSSQLQKLEQSLSTSEEFDAKKVDEIKQAIRDGRFTVNSEVVADKLLSSAKELFGNGS